MNESKNSKYKLLMLKVFHTAVWAFFVFVIFHILYSGIFNNINIFTWIAIILIIVEGIILIFNGWRCPLTIMGEKCTERTYIGFDIFLPRWIAKNNKIIFTIIYLVSVIIVIYRSLT
jgi:hypothetical protein